MGEVSSSLQVQWKKLNQLSTTISYSLQKIIQKDSLCSIIFFVKLGKTKKASLGPSVSLCGWTHECNAKIMKVDGGEQIDTGVTCSVSSRTTTFIISLPDTHYSSI